MCSLMQLQHNATAHQPQQLACGEEPVSWQPYTRHLLSARDLVNIAINVNKRVTPDVYPIPSRQVMGQYDEDECTLPMCVHHIAAKHGCDHLDAVNRTCIHLKKCLAIRASRFVIHHTIEDASV
ncbi:hypothetical protein TNCV_1194281 [Trichonephila clavipes]|nr:hypothetical protein TNCV_1194281 [Trichonephila clavipes]